MVDEYLQTHPHSRLRRVQRWFVKGKQPDGSTGKWDREDRKKVVAYLWWRDDRHCGLCAMWMEPKGAQIEHVVPKKFGRFDLQRTRRGLRAVAGREWETKLHHPDNLQVAHKYCNRAKGNTPDPSNWRHLELRPLPVAERTDGERYLWLPEPAASSHLHETRLPPHRDESRYGRRSELPSKAEPSVPIYTQQPDDELLRSLKAWRLATARAHGKPAYAILTDRTLQELVSSRPLRIEDLEKVHGIGPAKRDSYGQEILDLVAGKR